MTPKLVDAFGPLKAVQISAIDKADTYQRHSQLRRRSDGALILEASLNVTKANVPVELIDAMRMSDLLFGQLLANFQISAQVTARALFQTPSGRYGRYATLTRPGDDHALCSVEETLSLDSDLQKLLDNG
jgi:hypothetical protein